MFKILFLFFALKVNAAQLFIDDVPTLIDIEKQGYSFTKDHPAYKTVAETVARDLEKTASEDSGVGTTMKYSKRLFNAGWLTSKKSFFELAGIVYRPDKMFRHVNSCGEIRLIYRLAYKDESITTYSRLPMTVQHIRTLKSPCLKWAVESKSVLELLKQSELFDIELNLQSLRWPAAIKPDMGTYAEYLMRSFANDNGVWKARKLDNVLDVAKIKNDPQLKKELLAWLKNPTNMTNVDHGEVLIAEKFLADKAISIAVHGLNREANRLFSHIYTQSDFADIDFAKNIFIKSAQGYLRKLDESSCVGCHQSKSIAGFHFVGNDREGSVAFNTVKVPFSAHFNSDQQRRADFIKKITNKEKNVRSYLGFTDRTLSDAGSKNDRCYEGKDPSFVAWTCKPEFKCEPIGSAVGKEFFGICQEKTTAVIGDACYFGRVRQNPIAKKEKEVDAIEKSCGAELGCLHPSDGYPGGLCFANFCKNTPSKSCAMLAVPGFNPCLARGRPFKECLEKHTGSIEAANCDITKPCRDDFICAAGVGGEGVCAPPYSLFQLRLDGHSKP